TGLRYVFISALLPTFSFPVGARNSSCRTRVLQVSRSHRIYHFRRVHRPPSSRVSSPHFRQHPQPRLQPPPATQPPLHPIQATGLPLHPLPAMARPPSPRPTWAILPLPP